MKTTDKVYELIDREFKNLLNSSQKDELSSWIKHSSQNEVEYHSIRKLFAYAHNLSAMKRIDVSADLLGLKRRIHKKNNGKRFLIYFQRIASILIIPLLIFSLVLSNRTSNKNQEKAVLMTAETKFGVKSHLWLSDGTQVWLNSESKLIYPDKFNGDVREVKLIGEAYFIIQSDVEHPFYVDLEHYKVKATGTSFSISNYESDKSFTTYLEKGIVTIIESKGEEEIALSMLEKGELITMDRNNKLFRVSKVSGDKYLGWMEGKLVFKNDEMKEVARKLGRWFNVEVVISDSSLNEYLFTATFRHETLEETLKLLSLSSPIDYKIVSNDDSMNSEGIKRKIIISEGKK